MRPIYAGARSVGKRPDVSRNAPLAYDADMTGRKVTIRDLARDLNLSVGSVSNALNGNTGQVSQATVQRVREAAQRLGYSTNRAARSLKTGRQDAISLYIPEGVRSLNFYMDFMLGVVEVADEAHLDVVLTTTQSGNRSGPVVDGAVVVDWLPQQRTPPQFRFADFPVVAAGAVSSNEFMPTTVVSADYARIASEMVTAAIAQGAKKVAMLAPDPGFGSDWATSTEQGVRSACEKVDADLAVARIRVSADSHEVVEAAKHLYDGFYPDAVVFGPQRFAGIVAPVLGWGSPGHDVPFVMSCAGDPVTELTSPTITAIDADPRVFGRECARELIDAIETGPTTPAKSPRIVAHTARIHWATHWVPRSLTREDDAVP